MKALISKERIQDIIDLIEEGNYPHIAAQATGIHSTTWYRWLNKGEALLATIPHDVVDDQSLNNSISSLSEQERLYAHIAALTKKAEAASECADVRVLNKGEKDAIPRLAKLSRRHPERWSERRGEDEALKQGIAFLGKLAEALKKPQLETTEAQKTPLQLT